MKVNIDISQTSLVTNNYQLFCTLDTLTFAGLYNK